MTAEARPAVNSQLPNTNWPANISEALAMPQIIEPNTLHYTGLNADGYWSIYNAVNGKLF